MNLRSTTHFQPAACGAVGTAAQHSRLPGARSGGAPNAKRHEVIPVTSLPAGH